MPAMAAEWPRSTPAEQGVDASKLEALAAQIADGHEFPDLHGLLVVRHGRLIFERYFAGHAADQLHMLQSVSKSVTSSLIGIAIERGEIRGVEERVLDFFPDHDGIENLDARKRAMTLEDMLTMRSGTDYHERGANSPHDQLNSLARGWDRFVLNRPMIRQPGTHFQYDSGGVILMSSLIKARTGTHAHEYAVEHLFEPLGIEQRRWHTNSDNHPHTGGGLSLRPRDMARFGQMYLQRGQWKGRQIVPQAWVHASFQRHVEFESRHGAAIGYGYLWWVLPPDPAGAGEKDIYAAMGFRAQYIFVIREHDMVVVVTGGTRSWRDERKPTEFLYSHILPALVR